MRKILIGLTAGVVSCSAILNVAPAAALDSNSAIVVAAAPQTGAPPAQDKEEEHTPEETMNRRFPQPVRVGFLIGLPVLDWNDSTIGYIQQVVRTPEGKIQLIVPYNPWFGFVRNGGLLDRWRRPVAVPIETVAILARQVGALEMSRENFEAAPTFQASAAIPLPSDEVIRIAITRR
jgi:hypothetical protein